MKRFLFIFLIFETIYFTAQTKREQIEILKFRVDSLNTKLLSEKFSNSKEKHELDSVIFNLESQISSMNSKFKDLNDELNLQKQNFNLLQNQFIAKSDSIKVLLEKLFNTHNKLDQSKSFNGKYINSQGAVLTITNFIANKSFTLKYGYGYNKMPCSGNAWEGIVTLVSATKGELNNEYGQSYGSIEIDGDNINFQLSEEITGMECARYFDTIFVKK